LPDASMFVRQRADPDDQTAAAHEELQFQSLPLQGTHNAALQ